MKKKKRIPGKIKALAKEGSLGGHVAAIKLATYGQGFSDIEDAVDFYFNCVEHYKAAKAGGLSELYKSLGITNEELVSGTKEGAQTATERIWWIVQDAMDSKDGSKIQELACAVNKIGKLRKTNSQINDFWFRLLSVSDLYKRTGARLEMWKIAKLVLTQKEFNNQRADGFSRLRRCCKEIGFLPKDSRPNGTH